jgi:hypothetical protein
MKYGKTVETNKNLAESKLYFNRFPRYGLLTLDPNDQVHTDWYNTAVSQLLLHQETKVRHQIEAE